MKHVRVIIAAGGTGGHVFPALALGEEIRDQMPDAEILFIGTNRGLEDRVIPQAGFRLKTIVMSGLIRSFSPKDTMQNILMPFKLFFGMIQSYSILRNYKPDLVIGCGGYVTAPVVWLAAKMGTKILLQEQNSRPGRTTQFLSKYADEVHLAYEDAARFFKLTGKLKVSGNPIRKGLLKIDRQEAARFFEIHPNNKTLLVVGGSLGAHSINLALLDIIDELIHLNDINVLWQSGKNDYDGIVSKVRHDHVKVLKFIDNMSAAYSCADLVLCRAGAMTLSEITAIGIPAVLVPYPHAADNHQEYNANSLADRNAAVMILNSELRQKLKPVLVELLRNSEKLKRMRQNSFALRQPDAAKKIVDSMKLLLGI
ncbi:undecaprenyldiphospho-muramoylpentapeptide beta-N-acetylglucosaminyltransferase [bacterium]|nr:undecaprenyldiphospho-muramoylpentapeptide beta-N-acetylglucosaminyltransferase [bacterium]